jgi:YjbE family integral membrane protein
VLEWLRILGSIVLVDLVLSGDNALVIGAVAVTISSSLRWIAFVVGGGGAILLRILLTYSFTKLLQIPYLEAAGGVILLVVTAHLLISHDEASGTSEETVLQPGSGNRLRFLSRNRVITAIVAILAADVTTSLDNIVAIAALAKNNVYLLVIGLLLSIVLLLIGSAIITRLIGHLPWIILLAALVLTMTSIQLILQEEYLQSWLKAFSPWWSIIVSLVACIGMIYPLVIWFRHHPRVLWRREI